MGNALRHQSTSIFAMPNAEALSSSHSEHSCRDTTQPQAWLTEPLLLRSHGHLSSEAPPRRERSSPGFRTRTHWPILFSKSPSSSNTAQGTLLLTESHPATSSPLSFPSASSPQRFRHSAAGAPPSEPGVAEAALAGTAARLQGLSLGSVPAAAQSPRPTGSAALVRDGISGGPPRLCQLQPASPRPVPRCC